MPSGWTPIELLKHLTYVERRWLEWGFEGRDVAEPWGDRRNDRWYVAPDETMAGLVKALFHLVQEYARHVGHLDIVRELADGRVGE